MRIKESFRLGIAAAPSQGMEPGSRAGSQLDFPALPARAQHNQPCLPLSLGSARSPTRMKGKPARDLSEVEPELPV